MELTRERILRILLTRHPAWLVPEPLKIVIGTVVICAVAAAFTVPAAALGGFGLLMIVAVWVAALWAFLAARVPRTYEWSCPRLPLEDQPRLRAVIEDAGRLAGLDGLPMVRLTADRGVWVRVKRDGRVELMIATYLLLGMRAEELRTFILRELISAQRWSWHERWAVTLLRAHRDWEWLAAACAPIRHALTAETAALVGWKAVFAATRAELVARQAFQWHLTRYATSFAGKGWPTDLYESFRWKIQEDDLMTRVRPQAEELSRALSDAVELECGGYPARPGDGTDAQLGGGRGGERADEHGDPRVDERGGARGDGHGGDGHGGDGHGGDGHGGDGHGDEPGAGSRGGERLMGDDEWSPSSAGGVLESVGAALELRLNKVLAYRVAGGVSLALFARPYRLSELPAHEWTAPMVIRRVAVLDAATRLLGRPATNLDVVELVVAGRAGELEWWGTKGSCPHPTPGVCALMPLFDVALRRRGYTHEHVFAQRVLVGPTGDRVDLVELSRKTESGEPWGLMLGGPMTGDDPEADAIRLAGESLAAGDATGWFERLYAESATGDALVPWDSRSPHYLLTEWGDQQFGVPGGGAGSSRGRALVVGAGLGDDAEYVAGLGFQTEAFDVSESAVRLARERFPGSRVRYQVADLLDPPKEWHRAFDLVVEVMTVQSLPEPLHGRAIAAVAGFVRPGGTLVVIATGREEDGPVFAPPWPLTPSEIRAFAGEGLEADKIEDLRGGERHRWRAIFHRPA
ncbi:class I SAM-dependent methyltransferase [Nonomuraea fuscirosea]|uniref:class I SAM-dependent methyltransferase n=1 Tax=Nonomuraea fuscirosea TaxID=1291556 RepID=UPI003436F4E4